MDIRTATVTCPGCKRSINLDPRPREGQRFTCPSCGDYLVIINLEPLELDWAFDDFEPDWDPDEGMWDEEEWEEEEEFE